MSKKIKVLLSVSLAVIMLVGSNPAVIAQETSGMPDETITEAEDVTNPDPGADPDPNPDSEPTPDPEPEPEPEPQPKPEPEPDDIVGEIYLCFVKGTPGHTWVYILNTTDEYLRIGLYDVPPGEGISVATYGFSRYDGMGVYYNLETRRNENYCGDGYVRLKDSLTRKEAEKVTSTILTANYWDPFFNCTTFACRVWNRASDIPMLPMVIPEFTKMQMLIWGADDSDKMQYQPPENCYKQRGSGQWAYLEHCCQKTLDA